MQSFPCDEDEVQEDAQTAGFQRPGQSHSRVQAPGAQGLGGALLPLVGPALDQLLSGSLKNVGLSTNLLSSSQPETGLEVNRMVPQARVRPVANGHGQRCSERGALPLQSQAGRQAGGPYKATPPSPLNQNAPSFSVCGRLHNASLMGPVSTMVLKVPDIC